MEDDRAELIRAVIRQLLAVLGGMLLVVLIGYGLAALLRFGMAAGSPLLAAVGLGATVLLILAAALLALRATARRLADRPSARRRLEVIGIALIMGMVPLLMIAIVYFMLTAPE